MNTKVIHTLGLAAVLTLLTPTAAHSTLTMTLSGTPGSSVVNLSFSGSSTWNSGGLYATGFGWEFVPTGFDPFPAGITGSDHGHFGFISGTPSLSINGISRQFTGVFLQDSSNSPKPGYERFGGETPAYTTGTGDVWEWSGTAQIDLASKGLTFNNLNPGSVTVSGPLALLDGRLEIVPEPSSSILLGLGLAAFALRLWRKS